VRITQVGSWDKRRRMLPEDEEVGEVHCLTHPPLALVPGETGCEPDGSGLRASKPVSDIALTARPTGCCSPHGASHVSARRAAVVF